MFENIDIKAIKKELRNYSKNYIENFNKLVELHSMLHQSCAKYIGS